MILLKFFCVVGLQDVYNANSTRSYAKIEQSPKLYIGNQLITVDRFKNLPNASAIGWFPHCLFTNETTAWWNGLKINMM